MDKSLRNIKSIEHKTLKLSDYNFSNDQESGNTPASNNPENNWGVGILKSIVMAPFNMLNSKKSIKTSNNNLAANVRKNCFKLIRIQKIKINDESLFEIRYVQYFTPQQMLPLFSGDKKKIQSRIQLIDAIDSNGNKLTKGQSIKLLKNAIKSQNSDVDVILMPTMGQNETDFMVKNLKRATTLA
jgi:hypothetical protein